MLIFIILPAILVVTVLVGRYVSWKQEEELRIAATVEHYRKIIEMTERQIREKKERGEPTEALEKYLKYEKKHLKQVAKGYM